MEKKNTNNHNNHKEKRTIYNNNKKTILLCIKPSTLCMHDLNVYIFAVPSTLKQIFEAKLAYFNTVEGYKPNW